MNCMKTEMKKNYRFELDEKYERLKEFKSIPETTAPDAVRK